MRNRIFGASVILVEAIFAKALELNCILLSWNYRK